MRDRRVREGDRNRNGIISVDLFTASEKATNRYFK